MACFSSFGSRQLSALVYFENQILKDPLFNSTLFPAASFHPYEVYEVWDRSTALLAYDIGTRITLCARKSERDVGSDAMSQNSFEVGRQKDHK